MTALDMSTRPHWDVPDRLRIGVVGPLLAPVAGIIALGLLVGMATVFAFGVALAAVGAAGYTAWLLSRGRAVLKAVGARPLPDAAEPRFRNLAEGAARDLSIATPRLWTIPEQRCNALVAWGGGGNVALTEGALRDFTRTEMEAAVTHCMVRIATREARRATLASGLGSIGRAFVRVGPALDVRAAALTRYPPALAAALRRSEPIGGHEPLWLVAAGPTHAGREDRAEALLDL